MNNTIIYLIGFPGTGKYTIAREISKRTGAKLVDNHLINNPVFSLIQADGVTPLPHGIWGKTWEIRHVVLDVIRDLSPPDFSFVFTNQLVEGDPDDATLFSEVEQLARFRKSTFIPVRLLCGEEELCRRIRSADRAERFKDISPDNARKTSRLKTVLHVGHPNALTLDVTSLSPEEAAHNIIQHTSYAGV